MGRFKDEQGESVGLADLFPWLDDDDTPLERMHALADAAVLRGIMPAHQADALRQLMAEDAFTIEQTEQIAQQLEFQLSQDEFTIVRDGMSNTSHQKL